jgi:hypothetical protein
MLTTAQIGHFRTFGFGALPGVLGQYAEALRHGVDAALGGAYAATYDDRFIDGIGVRAVKLATYFDPLDAAHGALPFVPCSHHPDAQQSLCAYQHTRYQEYPGVAVGSSPGDVIAFDVHAFQATVVGGDRLAWAIEYLAEPGDEDERGKCLRWLADGFEERYRGFDREHYSTRRDWPAAAPLHPMRPQGAARLRPAGALDQPGAEIGW